MDGYQDFRILSIQKTKKNCHQIQFYYMVQKIPNEIIQPIMEIVGYALTFVAGVIAKWLQGKNSKQSKSSKNEK